MYEDNTQEIALTVRPEDYGHRIRLFLGDCYPLVPEEILDELLRSGRVLQNGEPCDGKEPLRKTDVIAVHDFRDVWENFGAEVIPAEVLYDDGHVLVVNKPTGCTVTRERHSGNCPFRNGILLYARSADWGERALAERYRPRTVHRIDRETSGAVIIATSREGELHLGGQFNDRALVKEYLAVVHGEVLDESGEIDVPIAPDARDVGRMQVGGRTAKRALTRYEIAERYRGFTLLRVFLETGRRHQIRVHLSEIGHPVVADATYGGDQPLLSRIKRSYRPNRRRAEKPLITRPALHAHALTFLPMGQADAKRVEAPVPADMAHLIKILGKHGRAGSA